MCIRDRIQEAYSPQHLAAKWQNWSGLHVLFKLPEHLGSSSYIIGPDSLYQHYSGHHPILQHKSALQYYNDKPFSVMRFTSILVRCSSYQFALHLSSFSCSESTLNSFCVVAFLILFPFIYPWILPRNFVSSFWILYFCRYLYFTPFLTLEQEPKYYISRLLSALL